MTTIYNAKRDRALNIKFFYANGDGDGWKQFSEAAKHSCDGQVAYSAFCDLANSDWDCWECWDFGEFRDRALTAKEKQIFEDNFFKEIEKEGWVIINK